MLVFNARFALLAAFCSLATLTFSPRWGVDAAAIQSRHFDHHHCSNVASGSSAQYVLPLPAKQSKVRTRGLLHSNPIALFADMAFARLKRDGSTWHGVSCNFTRPGDDSDPASMPRRSVLIPNNHGSEYVVSHSGGRVRQGRRRSRVRMLSGIEETPPSRRAQDAIHGSVALMSPDNDSATGRQIATLFAAPKGPGTWTLYASETNQTQFQLVKSHGSMELTSDLTPVTLEMGAPGETRSCATYDSSPPQDESDTQDSENMTMEPCADRATPEAGHKSQIFVYNSTSGTLEPTWNSGANTTVASSGVNQNSTTSSNATATSSGVVAAATLFVNRENVPQNSTVTLVFTPLKAMVADVGIQQNSTTTGMTTTMTKTVTVFNVAGVSTSTSSTASQVSATSSVLNVQLVGAPVPSSDATGSTTTGSASMSTLPSTATRSIDAAAVASSIASSASASSASAAASASASSTGISSSADNASPSPTQAAQRRSGRLAASDSKLTPVNTEPYTWMFKLKAEER